MTKKTQKGAKEEINCSSKSIGKIGRQSDTIQTPKTKSLYRKSPDVVRSVAIYIRISRDEDADGPSLPTQEKMCREYIAKEKPGWKITRVFSDDKAARQTSGPGFMDLMDAIDEGKVNAIVCLHLDRLLQGHPRHPEILSQIGTRRRLHGIRR